MELKFLFFVFGLTVNSKSEDLQDYQSLQTKSTIYPAALPSKDQNNSDHNSRKASTKSLPHLTEALITSPGTDLFHAPHERYHSTTLNTMTGTALEAISSRIERFVSNHGSGSFTSSVNSTSTMHLASGADLQLISDEKGEESVVTLAKAGSGLVMNSTMTAAAHLSRGRENIAASLHAPLNRENQRAVESITLLPAKSIPMLSASHPAVIDDLGDATETVEKQRKSINDSGTLKSLGASNPLNATESIFTDGEKTFVQKGSPTIMHLTAVPNRTQLVTEGGVAEVKMVAQQPGEEFEIGQSGQKNMLALSLVTHPNAIFDVDIPLPLRSSSQEVVKVTANTTKPLTTKGDTSVMRVYTTAMEKKSYDSKFSQPSEVPFPKNGKLHATRLFITPSLTPILHKILSAGDESEGEQTVTSVGDRQVGMTIHSPPQSVQSPQSTTLVKDEGRLKFPTVLPSKFTDRPSVLIKVKNATQLENSVFIARQNISSTASNVFHMSEHCCKVSIENGTLYPQGKESPDKSPLTDNRIEHFPTLIIKSMSGASSSMPFTVALRIMTVSAQKASDSDSAVHSGRGLTKITQSSLSTPSNSMHYSVTSDHPDQQKITTAPLQTPPRKIQNLSTIFEGHAVTYSPVKQLLIPSLTGSAKPLIFPSSPAGHTPFRSARVLKEHPLILPLGLCGSTLKSVTFQELKKVQPSTSFPPANKNREQTVFLKLPALHSERLIRTTNTWPVTGKSSVNSFFAQFTRTAGSDRGNTLPLSVSAVTPAPHTYATNVPTTTTLAENVATPFLIKDHKLLFFTLSNKKASQQMMPLSSSQDSVFHSSHPAVISKLLEISERSVISRNLFTNQTLMTEHAKEKHVNHSAHVPTFIGNMSGTLEQKTPREMDLTRTFSTQAPLKQQSEQKQSAVVKGERSTGSVTIDRNDQNTFSMQNKDQTPVTVLLQNTVPSFQSQGQNLQKMTKGQMNASVLPAAIESFQSAQPLAFFETPKTVQQTINQVSSLLSLTSTTITVASNVKGINGPLVLNQTTQHAASARNTPQQAASGQAPSTTEALKKRAINILAVKPVTLNPSSSAQTKATTGSVKSANPAGGLNMQSTSRSLSSTPSRTLTDFLTTMRAHTRALQPQVLAFLEVGDNVTNEHATQARMSSVTGGTFFAIDHADVSMAGSDITATESPQTGSLQLLEEKESYLSTVFPFKSNLAKTAEVMSDLPVMQRRARIASPEFLSGLAQISDDICGSGNYTAEMRLTLERDIMPGDLIPALGNLHVVINLKTNSTQVNLEIKSCCLSPTVTVDEFNTTCCLFSRLPIDPQGIRPLPSVLSKRAGFTINLFQMINYSTAYLHCDLSVCLRNNSECERCQQQRKAYSTDDGENIFINTGNRISFGPVLKEAEESSFTETTGVDSAETAVILCSVSGCFLACIALLLFWTIYRRHLQRSGHRLGQCWTPHGCSSNTEHFLP